MVRIIEGSSSSAAGLRVAIVASRFNDEVVEKLLDGAIECLIRHGCREEDLEVFRVPGAFEIPSAASRLARRGYDAIVTIGVLIRGETPHFDFISSQVTNGISNVAVSTGLPIAFGVITCETHEQAMARTVRGRNKGWEAALAAIEMASLFRQIDGNSAGEVV